MHNFKPHYPHSTPPKPGELMAVAEGVYWLRMPLPFQLDHINLWLLEEDDGWTIVDTGLASEETTDLWLQICTLIDTDKPVKRVIGTHMHPDHIGLAAWLCRRTGAELWMSRADYQQCRVLYEEGNSEAPAEAVQFYQAAGFSESELDHYRARFGGFSKMIRGMPRSYRRIKEGDHFSINNRQWQVITGEGHSPEHACLLCPELNIFISGDQLLPTISSNVSVWPTEPHANPLQDWLNSCRRLQPLLPKDVLTLPSHGLPFIGGAQRLQQLVQTHEDDLQKIYQRCAEPLRVVDLFPLIFKSTITHQTQIFAAGESYAHLHCLMARGLVCVDADSAGVNWYRRA